MFPMCCALKSEIFNFFTAANLQKEQRRGLRTVHNQMLINLNKKLGVKLLNYTIVVLLHTDLWCEAILLPA